jgi:hypothetical protein
LKSKTSSLVFFLGAWSCAADPEWDDKEYDEGPHSQTNYSLEFMQEVVDFADAKEKNGKRRRSWKTVHNRYKTILNQGYINRFRTYVEGHGSKRQKTENVDEIVYKKFVEARELSLPVHDLDIQRWALQAAHETQLESFLASDHWLLNFKVHYGLVSRKITNIVTRHEVQNYDVIQNSEKDFLKEFHELLKDYTHKQIYNTDQVGIVKELHSTRTLSFVGEKTTYGAVASKNSTTHSYTIQPIISLDGTLVGPIYLCLQVKFFAIKRFLLNLIFALYSVIGTKRKDGRNSKKPFISAKKRCYNLFLFRKTYFQFSGLLAQSLSRSVH